MPVICCRWSRANCSASTPQVVRALLGLEQRFLAPRVGFTLGLAKDGPRLLFGTADRLGGDAPPIGDPVGVDRRCAGEGDEEVEDVVDDVGRHGRWRFARLGVAPGRSARLERWPRLAVWGGR